MEKLLALLRKGEMVLLYGHPEKDVILFDIESNNLAACEHLSMETLLSAINNLPEDN